MMKLKTAMLYAMISGLALTLAALPTHAFAASLSSLQQSGQVGERPDGLVGVVTGSPSADVIKAVNAVNAKRTAEYEKIARETDAPIAAVKARAGAQIIARLPKGSYFMDAAGRWRQK